MLGIGAIIKQGDTAGCVCCVGSEPCTGRKECEAKREKPAAPAGAVPFRPRSGSTPCSMAWAYEHAPIANHVPFPCENILNCCPLGADRKSENSTSRPRLFLGMRNGLLYIISCVSKECFGCGCSFSTKCWGRQLETQR